MSNLRQEIIDTQKTRSDFLKWKLVGVAALGAVGLGLSQPPQSPPHPDQMRADLAFLVLPLIPPVCFYVDLLCRHLSLRILVIGAYLRRHGTDEQKQYEEFVRNVARQRQEHEGRRDPNVFIFEDWALEWSTIFVSALVLLVGAYPPLLVRDGLRPDWVFALFAIVSGAFAIVFSLLFRWNYERRSKLLDRIEPETVQRRAA